MATGLAEQLRGLQAPQTNLLLQNKRKPSLLFDTKEAANLDRETVYNIGLSGLEELVKLNPKFNDFKKTLFATSSINLVRTKQTDDVNNKLNKEIDKFLVFLSPSFLRNSAHKALEWLIHRFSVHEYNQDSYILLILPYYGSKIFVRALQLVDLSKSTNKWSWLQPLQKIRTPLSHFSLANQVTKDNGFLKIICNHVIQATKIYSEHADDLSTLYAFFTTALLECIERSTEITEVQFNHMLTVLLEGLSSKVQDFTASTYLIIAKLTTKTNIKYETIEHILLKALKKPMLTDEIILLILLLCNDPNSSLSFYSEKLMLEFSDRQKPWFTDSLCEAQSSGAETVKFIILFLNSAFKYIAINADSINFRDNEVFDRITEILSKVSFSNQDLLSILQNTLNKNIELIQNSGVAKHYFSEIFQSLEKRYPECFDKYLASLMQSADPKPEYVKQILQFIMSWYWKTENSCDIFTGLNHVDSNQRILAIKTIGSGNFIVPENLKEFVSKSLLERFNDNDISVIEAVLNLPINLLQNTFAADTLVDELIILVSKCHSKNTKYKLAQPALKILLELCDESDDTSVFLVTVPYLFTITSKDVNIAKQVLKSDFAKRNLYFKTVANEIGDSTDEKNIREVAFHYFLKDVNLLPPAEDILSALKHQNHGDAASVFFKMIILGSVCRVKNIEDKKCSLDIKIARQAIEVAAEMTRNFPNVVPLEGATHINAEKLPDALKKINSGSLPLQVNTYVLEMVHRYYGLTAPIINTKFDFEDDFERSQLILRLLEIVFEGMTLHLGRKNYPVWKSHYEWFLDIFCRRHFKSKEDLIQFLSKLFIKPVKPETSFYCLNMCLTLLDSCQSFQWAYHDDKFIVNLILALNSESNSCRSVAVKILKKLSQTFNLSMGGYSELLSELMDRNMEISIDHTQIVFILWHLLSPDPGVSSSHQFGSKKRKKLAKIREMLFDVILSEDSPIHVRSQLLDLLSLVNGPDILRKLVPMGSVLLQKIDYEEKIFTHNALKNILQRFDSSSVAALKDEIVWNFFMECLSINTPILIEDVKQYLSVIVLKQVDDVFFNKLGEMSYDLQKKFLGKLADIVTDCEITSVLSKITRLIKKFKINSKLIVEELKHMINLEDEIAKLTPSQGPQRKRKSLTKINSFPPEVVNSRRWKRGVTLLEFIQHSNNIENEELLLPILFELLKISISFEEQSPVEYTNQLVLSTIYNLATKSTPIKNADTHIDLIAQCIRNSHNPLTHHHALLVLIELFKLANIQRALQNIMPIFTFMGNTVLRQDDAYSIQIISKTIETIVPIINAQNDVNHVCELLKLFISSLLDIPEHRRVQLFIKLLSLLDNHLHLFYLLTFESHVLSKGVNSSQDTSEKLKFALLISQDFPVQKIIEVSVKLVEFLTQLPVEKDDQKSNYNSKQIFDVEQNSPKHLRHYKFTIVRFVISLLTEPEFINQVAELSEKEIEFLKPFYDKLIVLIVLFIQNTSKNAEINQGKPNGKYWKVMLHHLYDMLDSVNNLLPNSIFVASVAQLISHQSVSVKKKVLDLLNVRLSQKKFSEDNYEDLLALIDPITNVLNVPDQTIKPEVEIMQQTALITLKLLAKLLAPQFPDVFKPILDLATKLAESREGSVLGSAVLCVAELCSSMRIHAITRLNTFIPAIIRLLKKFCVHETPDILTISIISALQKIVESIGNFLSLYLDQLLHELARLNCLYTETHNSKIGPVVSRLKATCQKLSTCIPLRVLLPAVEKTYDSLMTSKDYQCISPLMNVLGESFNKVEISELSNSMSNLIVFFLKVLEFREKVVISTGEMEVDNEVTLKDVKNIEESSSRALISLILRLSEGTVRPLFYKIYDWAARNPQYKQRNITFYRLSANIAECLKFFFDPFAGHFLKHAAELLKSNNILYCQDEILDTTMDDEASRIELTEEILLTLHRVFSYNAHDFVNKERFEILMQPIVDQIENINLEDENSALSKEEIEEKNKNTIEEFKKRAEKLIVPCIASFVSAIPDDSLHKQLVYQILLKTRHVKPYVRIIALNTLVEIARKLGEDFMPLLPEAIPYIRELLEDDEETEKSAQNAFRTLTEILDVPLENFLK